MAKRIDGKAIAAQIKQEFQFHRFLLRLFLTFIRLQQKKRTVKQNRPLKRYAYACCCSVCYLSRF